MQTLIWQVKILLHELSHTLTLFPNLLIGSFSLKTLAFTMYDLVQIFNKMHLDGMEMHMVWWIDKMDKRCRMYEVGQVHNHWGIFWS